MDQLLQQDYVIRAPASHFDMEKEPFAHGGNCLVFGDEPVKTKSNPNPNQVKIMIEILI